MHNLTSVLGLLLQGLKIKNLFVENSVVIAYIVYQDMWRKNATR